jgi:hypothetical protein
MIDESNDQFFSGKSGNAFITGQSSQSAQFFLIFHKYAL